MSILALMNVRISSLPGGGVTGVRTFGTVDDRPNPIFLHCSIRKRFTKSVLAVPDSLRHSILESDHIMFPVANVISNFLSKNRRTLIVRVEVHIECVDIPTSVIVHDDCGADCSVCLASAVRLDTGEPWRRRICGYIVDGGEVDISASQTVQRCKVIQSQRTWPALHHSEIDLRFRVRKLCCNIGREIWILGLKIYDRGFGTLVFRKISQKQCVTVAENKGWNSCSSSCGKEAWPGPWRCCRERNLVGCDGEHTQEQTESCHCGNL